MQRRVLLLGAGALIVIAGFVGLRSVTRHQAGQVVDQGIDQFLARLPPGYAVRHGMVDYNPLTSSATVHSVVVTHDGATIGTADAVTVSGGNDQAFRDVFDPAAYPGGKPAWTDRRLLVADASARSVHLMQGTRPGNLVIGSVTLHRLRGRPFMLPPTPENRARPDFLADAALALAADTVQADEMSLATPAAAPGQAADSLSVRTTTVSDYDGGKLGSLAVKAAALDGDGKPKGRPFHVTADALDLKTANLRGVLEAIRQSGQADRGMLGRVTYDSAGLSGLALDMAAGPHLALADLHVSQVVREGSPSTGTAIMHGFTIATGQTVIPPAAAALLAAFGMNALTMDINAKSTMQAGVAQPRMAVSSHIQLPAENTVSEDIVLRGLGTFHVKASFSGYDAAQASPTKPLAALMATTLDGASIVYEDHSLTSRLFAVAAAQMHTTADVVRAQMAMPILTLGLMLPNQPDAADQLTNFLDHPGTLTVTMTPPPNTTLAQIAQAPVPARAQMLGVHVKADPAVP